MGQSSTEDEASRVVRLLRELVADGGYYGNGGQANKSLHQIDPNWPKRPEVFENISLLVKGLGHDTVLIVRICSRALSQIGERAVPTLREVLRAPEGKATVASLQRVDYAVRALVEMRAQAREAFDELLSQMRNNSLEQVREQAAWAICSFGETSKPAIPFLLNIIATKYSHYVSPPIRNTAVIALGEIGIADPEVLRSLQRIIDRGTEDPARYDAAEALVKLRRKTPKA